MNSKIELILKQYLNEDMINLVISNPKDKNLEKKIMVRPVLLRGELKFQEMKYRNQQVFHTNLDYREQIQRILNLMEIYRQMEIHSSDAGIFILISKKGKVTIKEKKIPHCVRAVELSHNRRKKYILDPDKKVDFLVDLGIQTKDGQLIKSKYDKFRQINRYLEIIEDVISYLPRDREIYIVDFGCGKSYLTFAMYYYLTELCSMSIRITGLDLKKDVIDSCNALAIKYNYEKLSFVTGDIKEFRERQKVDMVVSLHACDTATDYALHKAIAWEAKVILAVPCCQHELNGQINNEMLSPLLQYGILKERMAALLTDGLRGAILQNEGYQVQIMEFIDMEHTPKNILIRAVKKAKKPNEENLAEIMNFFHVKPKLAVLQQEVRKDKHHE